MRLQFLARFVVVAIHGIGCFCGLGAAGPEGVTSVRATKDTITLGGLCDQDAVRFVELTPYQSPLSTNFGPSVSRLVARSNFTVRLPRFDGTRDRLFSS